MDFRSYQNGMPRFTLDKRKPRGRYKTKCPKCGDIKSFVCVVDTTTGEPVDASRFGVCDHERRCGYSCWPTGKDVEGMSIIVSSNEVKKELKFCYFLIFVIKCMKKSVIHFYFIKLKSNMVSLDNSR